MRRGALDAAAMLALLTLCVLWGLTQVAIKVGNSGISPLLQAGLRSAGSALLLWGYARARGVPLFARDGSAPFGLAIALLFALEFVFLYRGLLYTTAARGILFVYTSPFVVALGAHWFVPGERLRPVRIVGLLCAFAGLVIALGDALRLPTLRELRGDTMELAAAIFWGATTVVIKARRRPLSPEKTLFYQLAGSAPMLLLLSWATGEPGLTRPSPLVLGSLAYQVVVVAFASYLAWFWLLQHYPAAPLAAFSFWTPIFGMLAGALLLGEPITNALALAMLFVAVGIYLVNRA